MKIREKGEGEDMGIFDSLFGSGKPGLGMEPAGFGDDMEVG